MSESVAVATAGPSTIVVRGERVPASVSGCETSRRLARRDPIDPAQQGDVR